jgi:hypothetical protein
MCVMGGQPSFGSLSTVWHRRMSTVEFALATTFTVAGGLLLAAAATNWGTSDVISFPRISIALAPFSSAGSIVPPVSFKYDATFAIAGGHRKLRASCCVCAFLIDAK